MLVVNLTGCRPPIVGRTGRGLLLDAQALLRYTRLDTRSGISSSIRVL